MQRSSYLANLAMAQQAHERDEWARKLRASTKRTAHQAPLKRPFTVNNGPLLGFVGAFLWIVALPLASWLKG